MNGEALLAAGSQNDPFHHLHDEEYLEQYNGKQVGCDGMVACAGRKTISLDGDWFFTIDPFDEGLRQKWFADDPLPPAEWTKPRDYDSGSGEKIGVPGCWTMAKTEWRHYEGGAWYSRNVEWNGGTRPRVVLRVGAANYCARVFLNGRFIASHRGGSTPFFVELTGLLRRGGNRLQIQVDNARKPERVPMGHFDWFNHGGLYREVALVELPSVFFREAVCQLVPDGTFSRMEARLTLSDPVDGDATVSLPELGLEQRVTLVQGRGHAVFEARPELWSPERPKLYDVIFRFADDVVRDGIGFREVRVEGTRILLNGSPLFLKGICVHEDDRELGKTSTPLDVRRRFTDAKELGCNFLRLSHYPHHEHVAEIADEMGLLLWEEIPVYWAIDFANPATLADAANQLVELIRRDANRASVIIWGVGNENADSDSRYAFMSSLAKTVRQTDPSRLVSAACLINREQFRIEDRLADHLDIIGLNEYFGWYEPDMDGLVRLLASSRPEKPVIISETGADAKAGHHGGADDLYTEECQARIFEQQTALWRRADYVCGATPWILYDYRSERRQTVFNQGFNRKGLIAEDKATRKLAFAVLEKFYRSIGRV